MTYIAASRDALARTLWIAQATDEDRTSEWARRAWDDMGGSEPFEERIDAELLADALIASGAVITADALTDPALIRDTAYALAEGEATYAASTVRHVLRALAAVIEERAR